jgi:hypothetical protein
MVLNASARKMALLFEPSLLTLFHDPFASPGLELRLPGALSLEFNLRKPFELAIHPTSNPPEP